MKAVSKLVIFLFLTQIFYSCNHKLHKKEFKQEEPKQKISIPSNLDAFYHKNEKPIGEILACGCLEEKSGNPIFTTIFYPKNTTATHKLFVTDSLYENKNDLINYKEVPIQIEHMFKGKLLKIDQELPKTSIYAKVVELGVDSLYISDAIKVNAPVLNTEKSASFIKTETTKGKVKFNWDNDYLSESKAFLTIISNENQDIRSCSYTTKNHFQLDDLTNVDRVMYPLDTNVQINNQGSLLWMSVNEDNWITRVAKIPFKK